MEFGFLRGHVGRKALLGACFTAIALVSVPSQAFGEAQVTPQLFQEVSSGIALIKTYGCGGRPIALGTGFLVGDSVVMTARHVTAGACRIHVRVDGENFVASRWVSWYGARTSITAADLETIKLDRPASGAYIFRIRPSSPAPRQQPCDGRLSTRKPTQSQPGADHLVRTPRRSALARGPDARSRRSQRLAVF
jgi:hypothetical protein